MSKKRAPAPRETSRHPPGCTGIRSGACAVTPCPYAVHYCEHEPPSARRCSYHQRPDPVVAPVLRGGLDLAPDILAAAARMGDRYGVECVTGATETYRVVDRLTGLCAHPGVRPTPSVHAAIRASTALEEAWRASLAKGLDLPTAERMLRWTHADEETRA